MKSIGDVYLDPLTVQALFVERNHEDHNKIMAFIHGRQEAICIKEDRRGNTALREIAEQIKKATSYITDSEWLEEELIEAMQEWWLSARTENVLNVLIEELELKTVNDLIQVGQQRLLATPNFGRKSLNELKELFEIKYDKKILE